MSLKNGKDIKVNIRMYSDIIEHPFESKLKPHIDVSSSSFTFNMRLIIPQRITETAITRIRIDGTINNKMLSGGL